MARFDGDRNWMDLITRGVEWVHSQKRYNFCTKQVKEKLLWVLIAVYDYMFLYSDSVAVTT